MTTNRVANHFPQFLNGVALCGNGVPKRGGDVPALRHVFAHFKKISLTTGMSHRSKQAGKHQRAAGPRWTGNWQMPGQARPGYRPGEAEAEASGAPPAGALDLIWYLSTIALAVESVWAAVSRS